ncbi:hypothetical protein HMN09_00161600 [Mycena chlorophos]|uniref:DUF6699 domain-containing protein n=1 Tax=Mycena chlorophos TaxID=658473 RepID=A0A8H6TQ52_MYCCL|nr:hypothetical protein HMN09_00161600 [Mycena chlorophos]
MATAGESSSRRAGLGLAHKPKKSVQFSEKNLLYSPIAWSELSLPDGGVSSLPPSPVPSDATFPPLPPSSEGGYEETASEPERMPAAPSYDAPGLGIVPPSPKPTHWTPPLVYSPWGNNTELPSLQLPSPPTQQPAWPAGLKTQAHPQAPAHYAWPPPPSPSPPPLYTPWPAQQAQLHPLYPHPPPAPAPSSVHLHILLAFNPFSPPTLAYDVAQSPFMQLSKQQQLGPTALEPATHPPLPYLLLRCRKLALSASHVPVNGDDWSIPVVPTTQPATGVVCVLDVLRAVYVALRMSVHRAEYESFPIALGVSSTTGKPNAGVTRADVDSAYFARCKAIPDVHLRRAEELKGVKRVDVLCGKTRFLGLSGPLEAGPAVWELNLSE